MHMGKMINQMEDGPKKENIIIRIQKWTGQEALDMM